MSSTELSNPFIVKLWWSFHDEDNLYLILDFLPGGDLATQLSRWGRLGRDRARFYTCEIVEGVEALHAAGIIYRDLKPGRPDVENHVNRPILTCATSTENILLGADGHVS
jgi:serum/glucocorticoid-regulated kinase 2